MAGGLEERGFTDGYMPEVGPQSFLHTVQPPRKAYIQEFVDEQDLDRKGRGYLMQQLAIRAVEFFSDLASVDWKTLEFRVVRTGMERPGETWRWEVWIQG